MQGFNSIFKCRTKGRGGGIVVFYRDNLVCSHLDLDVEFTHAEALLLKFVFHKLEFVLSSIYRPPKNNINHFNTELEAIISLDPIKKENLIMIGDINLCYLSGTYAAQNYLDILYNHSILNTIEKPTRSEYYNNRLTSTCLDHVNVRLNINRPKLRYTLFIVEEKIADHFWTGTIINQRQGNETQFINKTCKDFVSLRKVNEGIQAENWWPLLDLTDPNAIYEGIVKKFERIYDQSSAKRNELALGEINPWFCNEIKALMDHKNNLWKRLKKDKYNQGLRNMFRCTRNRLTNKIREMKVKYYHERLSNSYKDTKKTWNIINDFLNKKARPNLMETIKLNFKMNDDTQLQNLAEEFRNTFKNNIDDIKEEMKGEPFNLEDYINGGNHTIGETISMNLIKIDEFSLLAAIDKLNYNSSAGPDKIRPKDIKNNFQHLKLVLLHLINNIFKHSKIPEGMKLTYLRPLYKNGQKQNVNCYRPIGSISVITKIIEHFIVRQLQHYISSNKILHRAQFGFLPKTSTIDLLEILTNDINKALNDNKIVVAVATDLTKAFDLVDYGIMINKLKNIGIGGPLIKFFQDYFKERKLCTSIGPFRSSIYDQKCGLVQGSVLSPLLFNIYINDFASMRFNSKILQYADDNILYLVNKSPEVGIELMQKDLNLAVKYFFNNSIKLNSKKTKLILFKSPHYLMNDHRDLTIYCHNTDCMIDMRRCQCVKLKFEQNIKHLGVYFDSKMKFGKHIEILSSKMRHILFTCQKISAFFPISTKRIIYFSLVESYYYYGISIYYTAPKYITDRLKSLINRILKSLFNELELEILGIMSFDALARFTDLRRNYFKENLRRVNDLEYNLRNINFITQRLTNNYGKAVEEYRIPNLINSLPRELRNLQNDNQIRTTLKNYFLNNP